MVALTIGPSTHASMALEPTTDTLESMPTPTLCTDVRATCDPRLTETLGRHAYTYTYLGSWVYLTVDLNSTVTTLSTSSRTLETQGQLSMLH